MAKPKRRSHPSTPKNRDILVRILRTHEARVSAFHPISFGPLTVTVQEGDIGIHVGAAPGAPHLHHVQVEYGANGFMHIELDSNDMEICKD